MIIFKQEPLIRAGFFFGMLGLMGLWERLFPTRRPVVSKTLRWTSNLGMVVLSTLLLRAVFPLAAVGFAGVAASQVWGVFNILDLPGWLVVLLSVMILDLTIYLQHVMFHALPVLWRLHRVHHADRDFDTTTGLVIHREHNSNYGFNLPWWDYLCGTYRAQPAKGHLGMTINLSEYQTSLRVAQLPHLSYYEDMYVQAAEHFPGIVLDMEKKTLQFSMDRFIQEFEETMAHFDEPGMQFVFSAMSWYGELCPPAWK